jgi:carboxyl-terminal processing protease
VGMAMIPSPKNHISMDKQTNRRSPKWKLWLIAGALAGGGAITIAAGDSYFEISKNLEIFTELYKELNVYYVDDTKPGELMKVGIDAMLGSLDPYTQYIPESDMEDYRFMTTGQYGGIGALIKRRGDTLMISEPYEGFPAMKAGLRAGDRIVRVDGREVSGMDTEEVSKLLKGQAGTQVRVLIQRIGREPEERVLVREEIKIPDVPYKGVIGPKGDVGYLKLNSFTQTAGMEVRSAVKELKEQGATSLVLDLRGNGGGLLREAVNIVNLFVPRNQLVVETRGRINEWDKSYKTLSEPLDKEIPLVVLVDEGSASASEIVSGALQDLDRAVVVGKRTFGKGLVQQTKDLYYNAKLKVTVAKYYIPSGRCIQKLDYAHRDAEGRAVEMADSLIAEFHTANGRPVFDGRGIHPDVEIDEPDMPKVVGGLFAEDIFFDFANHFRDRNEDIGPAADFRISEELYAEFLNFARQRHFEYETETMLRLKELKETARKERYYEDVEAALADLQLRLDPDLAEELVRFRSDIEPVLLNELVARYHYQTGRAKAAMHDDPFIREAVRVLSNGSYTRILAGQ